MNYNHKINPLLIDTYKDVKWTYFPGNESKDINDNIKEKMIEAKRKHIRNQAESRKKSLEIIFNT